MLVVTSVTLAATDSLTRRVRARKAPTCWGRSSSIVAWPTVRPSSDPAAHPPGQAQSLPLRPPGGGPAGARRTPVRQRDVLYRTRFSWPDYRAARVTSFRLGWRTGGGQLGGQRRGRLAEDVPNGGGRAAVGCVKGMARPPARAGPETARRSDADQGQERVWVEGQIALAPGHSARDAALDQCDRHVA